MSRVFSVRPRIENIETRFSRWRIVTTFSKINAIAPLSCALCDSRRISPQPNAKYHSVLRDIALMPKTTDRQHLFRTRGCSSIVCHTIYTRTVTIIIYTRVNRTLRAVHEFDSRTKRHVGRVKRKKKASEVPKIRNDCYNYRDSGKKHFPSHISVL